MRSILMVLAVALMPVAYAGQFDAVDSAARQYLEQTGLPGAGVLIISRDKGVLFEAYYGTYNEKTQVSIASAAKWLSGATLMTVVDEEKISLDDKASHYLPQLRQDPQKAKITIRQLFNHTSGFPDADDEKSNAATLARSAQNVAAVPLRFSPGEGFLYGGGAMQIAGRIAEVAEEDWPWVAIFAKRIAEPLGMKNTVYSVELNPNPKVAGGVRSTMSDYGKFLNMLLHDGKTGKRRVLLSQSVTELLTDRTRASIADKDKFTVHGFAAARIEGEFLGYGVGCWINAIDKSGNTRIASSPGAFGFNPWIDLEEGYAAIWMIEDRQRVRRKHPNAPDMRSIISDAVTAR